MSEHGIVLHCPDCKKLLLRDAFLSVGDSFVIKCFHCGQPIQVRFDYRRGIKMSRILLTKFEASASID